MVPARRVLFVNHVSQMSGAEASLLGLLRRLPAEGFDPEVCLPAGGPLSERLAAVGIASHPVFLPRIKRRASPMAHLAAGVRLGAAIGRLRYLARRRGSVLVHANSNTAALAALPAARFAGVPGIWHIRDLVPLGALGRHLGPLATRVIAISQAVAAEAEHWGVDPARITVVANGVDADAFRPDPAAGARLRADLGIPPDAFVIAAVGQMVPWKGHHLLLDALGSLRRPAPDADIRAVLAGADLFGDHPEYGDALRRRAEEPDLAGAVAFLGHRPDVAAVYNACDVFVLPSRREPFGRAVIEAMACGKPVIAGAEAGPAEILTDGETGLLIPPGDATALAAAIARLREDTDLSARLAEAGLAHVRREYTEERTAAGVADVYREVLRDIPAPKPEK